jgi:pimeloyl-ACP methyl ester carboxylesterase
MREERICFTNIRGDNLCGILHHPSDGTSRGGVVLCHGMESSKESEKLVQLGRGLAKRRILTLRFDFACGGESSGKFEDITYSGQVEDLTAAFSLLKQRQPGKIGIFGSSMGGTVALLFTARSPNVAAVATVAAPLHPERFKDRLLTPEELRRWREQGYTLYHGQRINLSLLDDLEKLDVPEAAKKITCPVLILHGGRDDVVPVEEAYELSECLRHVKQLTIFPGADHRLSDPSLMDRAVAEAIDWFCRHVL